MITVMAKTPISASAKPSQDFVPIEQVRDGILVLRDGSIRTILMASSINIVLKSSDEQAAILGQFQNFLNTLDFSLQIFIQSRDLDINPYLALLEEQYAQQQTELMKIQVREYIEFIRGFVEGSSIMTKAFYLVVPYTPAAFSGNDEDTGVASSLSSLLGSNKNAATHISMQQFEEYRTQIEQRMYIVMQGLARTGIRAAQLGTEEVIELFYHLFNVGEPNRAIPLGDIAEN